MFLLPGNHIKILKQLTIKIISIYKSFEKQSDDFLSFRFIKSQIHLPSYNFLSSTMCSSRSRFEGGRSILSILLFEADTFEEFYSELHFESSDPSLTCNDLKNPI